ARPSRRSENPESLRIHGAFKRDQITTEAQRAQRENESLPTSAPLCLRGSNLFEIHSGLGLCRLGVVLLAAEVAGELFALLLGDERVEDAVAEDERDGGERPVLVVVPVEDDEDELAERGEAEDRCLEHALRLGERRQQDHERVVIRRELGQQDDEYLGQA